MLAHGQCHSLLVFSIARVDVQYRNPPRVFFDRVQLYVIVFSRQAFALGFYREIVWNLLTYPLAPIVTKLRNEKGVLVQFLTAVAVEAIAAKKTCVAVRSVGSIYILRNEEPARPANRLTLR